MFSKDLRRYGYKGFTGCLKAMLIPGYKYLFFFRNYQKSNLFFKPIFKLILRFLSRWYGIQIELNTKIEDGFYIGHFGNIVISGNTIIGKNCNISQGVTIGSTNRGKMKGSPIIGNEVWIGANAVLVGKVNIGNNVLIAPNSFVNFNVPNNSIVYGNPGIIKEDLNATDNYINNKI